MSYQLTSNLGWIDFSEEDKGKVMKVIDLLRADGTVDELGVGVVRNSLSDAMFNGITTIQTRAKYFFIIPRILQTYLNLKRKPVSARKFLYDEETRIMNELAERYGYKPELGIIGYTVAKENRNRKNRMWKQIERKPSTIYWNGMRTYGIFTSQYSLSNFLHAIEKNQLNQDNLGYMATDGEIGDDRDAELHSQSYFNLPPYTPDWDKDLRIELTYDEANFIRHQIIDTQKGLLIALVLENENWMKQFIDASNFEELSQMPFINSKDFPNEAKQIIYTARDFWRIMYGAHIRFNVLLQESNGSLVRKEIEEEKWNEWKNEMTDFDWECFDRDLMWKLTQKHGNVKEKTQSFINDWMDGIMYGIKENKLDLLVFNQEKYNKGKRAKLHKSNDEKYSTWIGINRMDFRFGNVKQIISDIAQGLNIIDA